jgi:hypothetical protein
MNNINWKLIFQLSIFGLAMAIATIAVIPEKTEPFFWLLIFIICAYVVAKNVSSRYFLHGFLISIINSIWITSAHILYAAKYLGNHPQMSSMNGQMPLIMQHHQRTSMAVLGLPFGALFGLVLGIFCLIASKMVRKQAIQ